MKHITRLLSIAVLLGAAASAQAQYLRSSYFMENSHYGMKLNPALRPDRGYVTFPGVNIGAKVGTNGFGIQDAIDCFDTGEDFYDNSELMGRLENINEINVSSGVDLVSFGFYKGKSFWSFNIGTRLYVDGIVPKSMFDFIQKADKLVSGENISLPDVRDEELKGISYVEIGLGYSRAVNEKLVVGGKVKALLGAAYAKMNIDRLNVASDNRTATLDVQASLEGNMKGLETTHSYHNLDYEDEAQKYIDGFEFNSFGVAGYGASIDLGATYQLTDRLMLSAAVTDLGFISWSKNAGVGAETRTSETYDESNMDAFYDRVGGVDVFDFELIGLKDKEELKKSRTTTVPMTLAVGAEYDIFKDKFSVGGLFTNQWGPLHSLAELTLSANYHPNRTLGLTGSYSMIQSGGKSFGFALKLGPLFVGTDYMYFGKNSRSTNAFVGLSFGIGKKRTEAANN